MKGRISLLTALLLLLAVPSARAEVITPEEARAIALQQVQESRQAQSRRGVPTGETLAEPITLTSYGEAALYVFNRPEGGYVIVSAESDARRPVLAWSDEGTYDPAHVPAPMKDVLDSYISGISRLRKASPAERACMAQALDRAAKAPARHRAADLPTYVDPLLGDIEWGQGNPYNWMVPTYKAGGYTYHYPTGCVATAIAQVMMYHRWPEQGRGSYGYEWNGQTLSADFNHPYRWDLMLPSYLGGYTDEQANAVAQLMYDVGVSVSMTYEMGGSGANFSGPHMVEFFGYDKNMRYLSAEYCSTEDWERVLRTELAEARPVLCAGGSEGGAHEFVCDGYDADGLFHYNFGWDGMSNGWFASTATGYDASPSIDYGIEKNHGGTGALSLMSQDDFVWKSDNRLEGFLSFNCSGLDVNTAQVTIEAALAVQNVQTGQVSYHSVQNSQTPYLVLMFMNLDDDLPDGTYQVYPVGRLAGEEWQTFFHNALRQIVVDLTVQGGVKTWANNGIMDPIDEGVVAVDGIYYILDEQGGEAMVTRRNERGNCYSGDVVIPDEITYEGRSYQVTSIGERAFEDCVNLATLVVGKNVTSIGFGALGGAGLHTITFAEDSRLVTIEGWAFNGCFHLAECNLPEGLLNIAMAAFQGCSGMRSISIPSSVTSIASYAFNGFGNLKVMHVAWTSFDNLYVAYDVFGGIDVSGITLYVPNGCVELYRSQDVWRDLDIQEESGENDVTWSYDAASATLHISGTGRIFWTKDTAPWASYVDDIQHLVVDGDIADIPASLFQDMPLQSVTLSEGVTTIEELAFAANLKLASVSLPESLTSIGFQTFNNAIALTTITLPSHLQTIGEGAFSGCYNMKVIRSHALTPPALGSGAFFGIPSAGYLIVPTGSDYSAWAAVLPAGWQIIYTDDVDGEVVLTDWDWTFDAASGTLTVTGFGDMPDNYMANGEWSDLRPYVRSVVIGEGITSITDLCFWGFEVLTSVSLPSTLNVIHSSAFYACRSLTHITCLATRAPDVSEAAIFSYMSAEGTLTIPEGSNYSTWLALLPAGWKLGDGGDNPDIPDIPDDDPLEGTQLYVLGNDGNWDPSRPSATLAYRTGDKSYVGDIVVADAAGGYGYFCIGKSLGADSGDWVNFNADRLGAPYGDYPLAVGGSAPFVLGSDASFCVVAGTHHLVVDMADCQVYLDCPDGITPHAADTPATAVYDLTGRRVTTLQPGTLYIRDGRKFIAR